MGLLGERLTLTNGKIMKDEIRVSCFGASVTQQKTGYATLLESELGSNYKVTTHGFGGTYLNDGELYTSIPS